MRVGTATKAQLEALLLAQGLSQRLLPRWHGRLAGIQWAQRTMALTRTGIYFSKTGDDKLLDCIPLLEVGTYLQ